MIGLKIFGLKRIVLTIILIYLAVSALTLATSPSYELIVGLKDFLQGFEIKKPIIIDESAKSVYTSILPARLAKDLNIILGLNAEPVTATLGYIDGILAPLWSQEILEDNINSIEKNWIILGEALAAKLGKKIGDIVIVTSILRKEIHILKIIDIRSFNDPRDNYGFISREIARTIRGINEIDSSIIIFRNQIEAMEASKYLGQLYELKIHYNIPLQVRLRILASDGSLISEKDISNSGVEVFKLPLGYYQLMISTSYTQLPIASIKLKESREISIRLDGSVKLKIIEFKEKPLLKDMNEKIIEPQRFNNTWIYEVPVGIYFLKLGDLELKLPLINDLELKQMEMERISEVYKVRLEINWIDGKPIEEAYLTILTKDGGLITAVKVTGFYEIYLPRGEYLIKLIKGSYALEENFKVDGERIIQLIIPLRSSGECPYSPWLKEVKVLATGYDETSMISLMALSAEIAILASSIILSIITYTSIIDHLYESASKELNNLKELKLPRKTLLKMTYLPVLGITMLTAGFGGLTAFLLVKMIPWMSSIPLWFLCSNPWIYLTQTILISLTSICSYMKEILRIWS
jgi:hypothetical protein